MREMKDSGIEWIGEIPEGWEVTRAKNIFTQSFEKGNESLELLSATQENGVVPKTNLEGVVQVSEEADLNKFKTVHINDFVISLRSFQGGFEMSNYEGVITPAYSVFRSKIEINHRYYWQLFKSNEFISKINSLTVGIREGKNIYFEDFSEIGIPFPKATEQTTIANYLDDKCGKIDVTIQREKQHIEKLKEYRQSVITEAVTKGLDPTVPMKDSGIKWIGEVPQGWEIVKLKHVSNFKTGTTPSSLKLEYFEGDYNWFTPADFTENLVLSETKRKVSINAIIDNIVPEYPPFTILIIGIGATTGKIGMIREKSSSNQQITAIMSNECFLLPKFLLYFLFSRKHYTLKTMIYTTLPILNNQNLGLFEIAYPNIPEQTSIADYLDRKTTQIDSAIAKKETLIEKLTEYKKSMIYEAVTGKVEVS